jgi:hypothetical protein
MEAADVRRAALALAEVEEYEHGGLPAFRVRGTRFASMLDADGVNLMLGADGITAALAAWPDACEPRHFAGRLASVRVAYRALPADVVSDLVAEAWAAHAPKRLLRE